MLVHEVEHAGDALVMSVGEKALVGRSGTPFSMGSGITPPAPEIGWPPPSNMSEKLTASRAPFGQKPAGFRSDALIVGVAALAAPDKPSAPEATASAAVAPTV
jgi:hypothetical protein